MQLNTITGIGSFTHMCSIIIFRNYSYSIAVQLNGKGYLKHTWAMCFSSLYSSERAKLHNSLTKTILPHLQEVKRFRWFLIPYIAVGNVQKGNIINDTENMIPVKLYLVCICYLFVSHFYRRHQLKTSSKENKTQNKHVHDVQATYSKCSYHKWNMTTLYS